MKKKITSKIVLIGIVLILIFSRSALATQEIKINTENISDKITNPMKVIIGIFQVVAVGIGSIMLVVLAIKYMAAAPGDKAEIKKHVVVYIVGACMAFASSGIVGIIQVFANEATKIYNN